MSPVVATELAEAVRLASASAGDEGHARLKQALAAAAADARERGLSATDLLIAFKDMEREAFMRGRPLIGDEQTRLRQSFIASLLRAYYSES